MKIAENSYVGLEYVLTIDSGEEIDRSPAGQPLGFIAGADQIIPGLEKALIGMAVGDESKVTVEPEEAYGQMDKDMVQQVPKSHFPAEAEITPGMSFQADGPNGPFMVTIAAINDDDTVTVDLNHPLAGERLHFEVRIVEVREASAEEMAQLAGGACSCGCDGAEEKAGCGTGCQCG